MSQGKDRWDKAAIIGSLTLPVVVAVVGAGLGWLAGRAQREYEAINTRTSQLSAVSALLDALTDDDCESSARKRAAIRLVYHVLDDEETASDILLAASGSTTDGSCARLASQVFASHLAETPSALSEAVATIVGTSSPTPVSATTGAAADPEVVQRASQLLRSSPYASLVIPAVVESGLTSDDPQATQNVGQLLQEDATMELASRNPYLADIGEAFLESEIAANTGVPSEAAPLWRLQVAPAPP